MTAPDDTPSPPRPARRKPSLSQIIGWTGLGLVVLFVAAVIEWHSDIRLALLDPGVPYQTYSPPPQPDYARDGAWALQDATTAAAAPVPVFFVHPTTYAGGDHWNAPIDEAKSDAYLQRAILPNYAGPFARSGAVSAPRYRQAGVYTRQTNRYDALQARAFAYRDIDAAFTAFLTRHPTGPFAIAGVEQGGDLAARLLTDRIAPDAALRRRMVGAWISEALLPADLFGPQQPIPACARPNQTGCLVAWSSLDAGKDGEAGGRYDWAMTWSGDRLEPLGRERPGLCVNPVLGAMTNADAPKRLHLGGATATGLEWGVRPAFLQRQVDTQCRDGLLRFSRPASDAFARPRDWAERRMVRPYNLFYADIEEDFERRVEAWRAATPAPSPHPNPA